MGALLLFLSVVPFVNVCTRSVCCISPRTSSNKSNDRSTPFRSVRRTIRGTQGSRGDAAVCLQRKGCILSGPLVLASSSKGSSGRLVVGGCPKRGAMLSDKVMLSLG